MEFLKSKLNDEMYVGGCIYVLVFVCFDSFLVLGFSASKDGSVSVVLFYISKFISSFFSLLLSRFNISVFFGTW